MDDPPSSSSSSSARYQQTGSIPSGVRIQDARTLEAFCDGIGHQIAGADAIIPTPFGHRRIVYADHTASGRSLLPIENYILDEVLPVYANIHSGSTYGARQSGHYREEARELVRSFLNATHEDAVIFAGNGATGCVERLVSIFRASDWELGRKGDTSRLRETRWGTFVCGLCNDLQLDNESAAKAHLSSAGHRMREKEINKNPHPSRLQINSFLIDPSLHHSSFLPFKEQKDYDLSQRNLSIRFLNEWLPFDKTTGHVDIHAMELALQDMDSLRREVEKAHPQVSINVFVILSACSNITGIKLPVNICSQIIHRYGGVVIYDLASAIGTMDIDLNPKHLAKAEIDIAFYSPHKLLGGPGSTGILTIKKWLLRNTAPGHSGGGVVRFVSKSSQLYTLHLEEKEEAGTPNIIACIRAGMAHKVASLLPISLVAMREWAFLEYALNAWNKERRIQILGPATVPTFTSTEFCLKGFTENLLTVRKAVVSLAIKYANKLEVFTSASSSASQHPINDNVTVKAFDNVKASGGLYLHHNFVCALLNDLFGIQARPGCACAGPLAHHLLGMEPELANAYERCLEETGCEVLRPGFVRISFHYSQTWDDVELITSAVSWIASFGWRLLPFYTFDAMTGEWEQSVVKSSKFRKWFSVMHLNVTAKNCIQLMFNPPGSKKDSVGDTFVAYKRDPKKLVGAVPLPGFNDTVEELKAKLSAKKVIARAKTLDLQKSKEEIKIDTPADTKCSVASIRKKIEEASLARAKQEPGTSKRKAICHKADVTSALEHSAALPTPAMVCTPQNITKAFTTDASAPITTDNPQSARGNSPLDPELLSLVYGRNSSHNDVPRDLGEYYKICNDILDSMNMYGQRSGERDFGMLLSRLSKRGLSPPLPAKWAHLLWFALPGDAAMSLKLFERANKSLDDCHPSVAINASAIGYPIWLGESQTDVKRVLDSPWEVRRYSQVDTLPVFRPLSDLTPDEVATVSGKVRKGVRQVRDEMTEIIKVNPLVMSMMSTEWAASTNLDMPLSIKKGEVSPATATPQLAVSSSASSSLTSQLSSTSRLATEVKDEFGKDNTSGNTELSPDDEILHSPVLDHCNARDSLIPIPKPLRHRVGESIREYDMIRAGDKILVGLSGGKDSLTLLHILRDLKRRSPVKFELGAATVDPETIEYNPSPLIDYVASLNIPYHMIKFPIMELAKEKLQKDSLCSFCARMKRGLLYRCMKENGYTVLALGQHLDDIAESFLMSAFYNGALNTMKAHYKTKDEDGNVIRVIRPLCLVREADLAAFAKTHELPVISDNCPACFAAPKERLRMKHLLAEQEYHFESTMSSIARALKPLMKISDTDCSLADDDCLGMCKRNR